LIIRRAPQSCLPRRKRGNSSDSSINSARNKAYRAAETYLDRPALRLPLIAPDTSRRSALDANPVPST
jgi:hypothetical protein